ncbi:MAG: hypothetical protein J6T74_02645 [Clostridia bacterium]|nr:hypothetical protein [Clostridia bacterium]
MNNTNEILLLILIGVFASANDVDLANNTTILLLLALILFGDNQNFFNGNRCRCGNSSFFA